ncbi:PD-(D/E)XK nuclease family protein [Thermoflavimicrobium dichotomicum]|uniref:ATP-dependent helicase/DNAse subunit B n=1 Tax=Thermoflavimicrobium dichotomicum TaxID=46223 RepID=A0A1I3MUD9_9BACL|nr:PD-(D/E)XK nuclease family protein [Thermoflavimicrobium dichotomicum]SFJ00628.1 ATP-dependent helicase/DNAse subunit B [Thermoflavimicrobium dichotomicum]
MAGWIYLHPVSQATLGMAWNSSIKKPDKTVYYIVPSHEQARFLRQKHHGHGVEWMTFDQLAKKLVIHELKILSPMEQHWLVRQILWEWSEQERIPYFLKHHVNDNWIDLIVHWINEMKRANILPQRLQTLWKEKDEKYKELALLYKEYQNRLEQYQLCDQAEMYIQLMKQLSDPKQQQYLKLPDQIVLEQFYHLYPLQEQLLIQLITCGIEVELHLIWDMHRSHLFQETNEMIERLLQRGFQQRFDYLDQKNSQPKSAPLLHLAQHVFTEVPLKRSADHAVHVLSAPGIEAEVEQVVSQLKKVLCQYQIPCAEVAIISSNLEKYQDLLYSYLEQAGIPVGRPWEQKLVDHLLFQTLLAVFYVQMGRNEWWSVLLESPYLPFRQMIPHLDPLPIDLDEWEQRLIRYGEQSEGEETAQAVLECLAWMKTIPEQATWSEWIKWLSKWVIQLKPVELWREMAKCPDRLRELAEEMQAWHGLEQLIENAETLIRGDFAFRSVTRRQWVALLEQAASQWMIQKRPAQKGGIQLFEANLVQGHSFRVAFLLGCVEGEWPRPFRDNWLLPDHVRWELRQEGVYLSRSQELRQRQLYSFFMSMISATELLFFSYPHMDEKGKKQLPSPYLEECLAVFDEKSVIKLKQELSDYHGSSSFLTSFSDKKRKGFAVSCLATEHEGSDLKKTDIQKAIRILDEWKQREPGKWQWLWDRIKVERLRYSMESTPFHGKILDQSLLQKMAEWINTRVWHVYEIQHLMSCPFRFMADYLWKVDVLEKEPVGINSRQIEQLVRALLIRIGPMGNGSDEKLEQMLQESLSSFLFDKWDSFYIEWGLGKIRMELHRFLRSENVLRKESSYDLEPRHLALSFGYPIDREQLKQGQVDPASLTTPVSLKLTTGRILKLRGKIDRVDQDKDGDYIIYHYKLGTPPSIEAIRSGQDLHLILSLWGLQQGFGFDPEKVLGVAYYTRGKRGAKNQRNSGLWKKNGKKKARLSPQAKAFEEAEWQDILIKIGEMIDEKIGQIERGDCLVKPTWSCPDYCPKRTVCRIRAYQQHRAGEVN